MFASPDLTGKTALVTGATSGIGLQTLNVLARSGVEILAVGRDQQRCQDTARHLRTALPGAKLTFFVADLSLQREVRRLIREIQVFLDYRTSALDYIFHIAGVYSSHRLSSEGIELSLATNHLAPFILNLNLYPYLQQTRGRIITVTSHAHFRTWLRPNHMNADCTIHGLWAYKISKLAGILTNMEFNRCYRPLGITALLLDPGLVNTDIGCKTATFVERTLWDRRQRHGVNPQVPAQALLQLAALPELPNGSIRYWRYGAWLAPSRAAQNPRLAIQVWRATCGLCGIALDSTEEAKWNNP